LFVTDCDFNDFVENVSEYSSDVWSEIGQLSALSFQCIFSFQIISISVFKPESVWKPERRLESKIEAKFHTPWPLYKLGEGWAKCLNQFYEFGLGGNKTSDILKDQMTEVKHIPSGQTIVERSW